MNSTAEKPFAVIVADNFHYMDDSEQSALARFDTLEEAQAACRAIVEKSLQHFYEPGMTPEQLIDYYKSFGDDPFIRGPGLNGVRFSAWTFARERAASFIAEREEKNLAQ